MSVEEIKRELISLTNAERSELTAYLYYLRHRDDEEHQQTIARRLADADPANWLTIDEVERRLSASE